MPETVSSLEVIRLIVAAFGMWKSWQGQAAAHANLKDVPSDPTADGHERREREQRSSRMRLFAAIQGGFIAVHFLLLVNVVINMGYGGASIEQPNVMSSNVAQILIPMILTRLSEMMTMKLGHAVSLHVVAGERTP